ncbi:MAG: methylated-DNA--[Erysipelotrichaceae bacterium]|nr:methylated-DNA--[protein]-cysteine S-methyltransferase [Erysipelotrichaceae bacterium]
MYYQTKYDSIIGTLLLVSDGSSLCGLYFPNRIKEYMQTCDDLEVFVDAKKWLDSYFLGDPMNAHSLSIRLEGTAFQKQVWNLLLEIPYGKVVTYKDIARKISATMSCQAVGTAIGKNPIGIIIPCHRVVGYNNLGGFSGGIENKVFLLEHEGVYYESGRI